MSHNSLATIQYYLELRIGQAFLYLALNGYRILFRQMTLFKNNPSLTKTWDYQLLSYGAPAYPKSCRAISIA